MNLLSNEQQSMATFIKLFINLSISLTKYKLEVSSFAHSYCSTIIVYLLIYNHFFKQRFIIFEYVSISQIFPNM